MDGRCESFTRRTYFARKLQELQLCYKFCMAGRQQLSFSFSHTHTHSKCVMKGLSLRLILYDHCFGLKRGVYLRHNFAQRSIGSVGNYVQIKGYRRRAVLLFVRILQWYLSMCVCVYVNECKHTNTCTCTNKHTYICTYTMFNPSQHVHFN